MPNTSNYPSGGRYFSATLNDNHSNPNFNFYYCPTFEYRTPAGQDMTGAWIPSQVDSQGNVKVVSTSESGSYTPSFNAVTSGQIQIPVGAKSYSIAVESGRAFVNGVLFNTLTSYNGGNHELYSLSNSINVGCTGGRVIVIWEN